MPVRPPQGHRDADGLPDTRILPPTSKARAASQDLGRVDTHPPLPVVMPSRFTVVISLDPVTEHLLEEVKKKGGNVSAYVRSAIIAYAQPVGDAEHLGMLAEARYKQIKTLKTEVKTLILLLDTLGDYDANTVLGRKISSLREAVFDE
jgi:hypothetical protein